MHNDDIAQQSAMLNMNISDQSEDIFTRAKKMINDMKRVFIRCFFIRAHMQAIACKYNLLELKQGNYYDTKSIFQ